MCLCKGSKYKRVSHFEEIFIEDIVLGRWRGVGIKSERQLLACANDVNLLDENVVKKNTSVYMLLGRGAGVEAKVE
jgi:hypothetical protein